MKSRKINKIRMRETLVSYCLLYTSYPISSAAFCMAVSKNALEEAGAMDCINLEGDRTWTTEQFEEMMKKLSEAGFMGGTVYLSLIHI